MSAPAPLGKNRAAARVCNCITLIHWGRAEGAGRTLICWVLLVDDCVWLWLPRYGVGHGADAEIPVLQGGAEMSHRAQHSSSQGWGLQSLGRTWRAKQMPLGKAGSCSKSQEELYSLIIVLCLCDFYFSHLWLHNRHQNQKPTLCQLCLKCAVPPVATSDPGHDLPTSVPKNFNSTGILAFADVEVEVMEVEGHNLTL